VTLEVRVRAGAAVPFKTSATPQDAQLLRTVVWSLDVGDAGAAQHAGETATPPSVGEADKGPAASPDLPIT
jgi:hypothetical protein